MKTSIELGEDNIVEFYLKLSNRELMKYQLKTGEQPEGIFKVIIEGEDEDDE